MTPHALGLHLAVSAGLGALATVTGEAAPWCMVLLAGSILAGPLRPVTRWVPAWLAVVLGAVVLVVRAMDHAPPVDLVAYGLLALLAQRRIGRDVDSSRRAAVLISTLMLVVAGGRSLDPVFLVFFFGWTTGVVLALLPDARGRPSSSMLQEAAPLLFVVPMGSLLLYPLVPRLPPSPEPSPESRIGFSDVVDLGDLDALLDDPTVVLSYEVDRPVEGPIYLRGGVLGEVDGRRWVRSEVAREHAWAWPDERSAESVVLDVRLSDASDGVIFTPANVLALAGPSGRSVGLDPHGGVVTEPSKGPITYRVLAAPPWQPGVVGRWPAAGDRATTTAPPELGPYLVLPDAIDPRVLELGRTQLGDEATPVSLRVERLLDWFGAGFRYTRQPADGSVASPLTRFLFEERAGHCQHFAIAGAVLLRASGTPARPIVGFAGAEPGENGGQWTVRSHHAHMWIEVWDEAAGWVAVDPTPGPASVVPLAPHPVTMGERLDMLWERLVVRYDGGAQIALIDRMGRAVAPGGREGAWSVVLGGSWLLGAAVGLGVLLRPALRRWRARRAGETVVVRDPVAGAHARARAHLLRVGWEVPTALPPVAAARWLAHRLSDEGGSSALEDLAWLYYEVQLGGRAVDPALAADARKLARRVVQIPGPRATRSA